MSALVAAHFTSTYCDLAAAFPLQAALMLSRAVALSLTPDGWRFHRVIAPLSFSLRSLHASAMTNSSVQFSGAAKTFKQNTIMHFSVTFT